MTKNKGTPEQRTQRFKTLCVNILAQSGNCQESQHTFKSTQSIPEMCEAWRKYWHGLITEVPQQVIDAFKAVYPEFKADINQGGIFYNEDSPTGTVLVGDTDEEIHLYSSRKIYVLGKAHVILHNAATALVMNEGCKIELLDGSKATIKAGYGIARNYAHLVTCQEAECYDQSVAFITDGTLHDHGHKKINAFGTALIDTFTHRLIDLYDSARIEIRK